MTHFALTRSMTSSGYLIILSLGLVFAQLFTYLGGGEPVLKGQSTGIVSFFVVFGLAFIAWLNEQSRFRAVGLFSWFLVMLAIAWVVHLILYRLHGDAFNYTSLLYLPILVMIWLKPPPYKASRISLLAFAWSVSFVLVFVRILEMIGLLEIKEQSPYVIAFDEERYFLPLNDLLGISGRWPGPFGHNGHTAMMGAFLIVIGVAYWTRASWIFLSVGALTLLVTSGRASVGAAIVGLIVLFVAAKTGPVARIPLLVRSLVSFSILVIGALFMLTRSAGSTGRGTFWPAFLELWQSSPLVGIGSSGISVSGGITQQYGHAHSLYIDELARYGLLGFVTQFGAIAIGLVIAFMAARQGAPGGLAIMVTYLVTGITEPRNDWIAPSVTGFLLILAVVASAAYLRENPVRNLQQTPNPV